MTDKTTTTEADVAAYKSCGGCGATHPDHRCVGCMHVFCEDPTTEAMQRAAPASPPAAAIVPGGSITFTPHGAIIAPPESDTTLDRVISIRDEYRAKRSSALDQMEMNAQQANTADVSFYSSEAERHGAALHACNRILSVIPTPPVQPAQDSLTETALLSGFVGGLRKATKQVRFYGESAGDAARELEAIADRWEKNGVTADAVEEMAEFGALSAARAALRSGEVR